MRTLSIMLLLTTAAAAVPVNQWNGEVKAECAVVRVDPPDHDSNPGYKVTVVMQYDHGTLDGMRVEHTLADGTVKSRGQQYRSTNIRRDGELSTWTGLHTGRNGNHTVRMVGIFNPVTSVYNEVIFDPPQSIHIVTSIFTKCHPID